MQPGKRLRDVAVILPLGGILLLMPPYVRIFDQPVFVAGIPLLFIYLFAVWLIGIALTGYIAHRLVQNIDARPTAETISDTLVDIASDRTDLHGGD